MNQDYTATVIFNALVAKLGPDVLTIEDIPDRNHSDWSSLEAQAPAILARPVTTAQVCDILRLCNEHGMSVVPQGGLTGLSGGARPIPGCLALSLERMCGIVEIDEAAATMTVKAGTPLYQIQQSAEEKGLYFPLDLGARGSCAIAGNISTNAGGNRVIRYGMARNLVLGMEVVLPDGTPLTNLNKLLKNNTGYDLKQLFIGAEGTLGVVTQLVLRLYPLPECTHVAVCGLADYASVLRLLVGARRKLGPTLSAFEVMWSDYWQVAIGQMPEVRDPLGGIHYFHVLVEAQGSDSRLDGLRFESWLEAEFEGGNITDAAMSRSVADIRDFWACRDTVTEFKRVLGSHLSYDVSLAVRDMDSWASECREQLAAQLPGCQSMYYGHIADGNLHLLAWLPGANPQPEKRISQIIYQLVRDYGGSVSAEHGIGLTKKPYLGYSRSEPELELMRGLKRTIDPKGIMNPGKVIDVHPVLTPQ